MHGRYIEGHSYHLCPHCLTQLSVFLDLVLLGDDGGCSKCCPVGAFQLRGCDGIDHDDVDKELPPVEVEE